MAACSGAYPTACRAVAAPIKAAEVFVERGAGDSDSNQQVRRCLLEPLLPSQLCFVMHVCQPVLSLSHALTGSETPGSADQRISLVQFPTGHKHSVSL